QRSQRRLGVRYACSSASRSDIISDQRERGMRKVGEFAIASVAACCLATALCAQQSNQPGAADTSKSSTASKPTDKSKAATPANGQPNPQAVPGSQTGPQSGISSTIRVPVDLVNVPFTVLDKKNRMVIDLTQKDFRL